MHLLNATLTDFRNFHEAHIKPGEALSALVGPNGQGKTNAIEALYLVAALRPLRSVPRRALIRSGAALAAIKVSVHHTQTGLEHELELRLKGGTRRLFKDEKEVSTLDFLGGLVAISFTPDDLQLAKGSPDARRRFIDRALLNAYPNYLKRALRYSRAMRDRNKLLQKQGSDRELDAFDSILSQEGGYIIEARSRYIERIAPKLIERFTAIAQPAPQLSVRYSSTLSDIGGKSHAEVLLESLARVRSVDRRKGTTTIGPHRDDLVIEMDGLPAKERASQGQHRALILALKLVELEDLAEDIRESPLLLLDDMSSELDDSRTRQLFECVRDLRGQVIMTSTFEPQQLLSILGTERSLVLQRVQEGKLSEPELFSSESP